MDYQSFEPGPKLRDFVKCYWTLESSAESIPQRQRIVPDGCMELIFHCGDLYKQYLENGTAITQPRCFVFGQITQTLEIAPTGRTAIFSVRFHPDGFLPFSPVPLKDLDNTATSLEHLFGENGIQLEKTVLAASSTSEKINLVENFLINQLADETAVDRVVKTTVETIMTANGQLSVDELSRKLNVNRRQLERRFSTTIGLSPKQLSKMIRLQAALKLLAGGQFRSLTALAHESEYYDQAHFIKDFKEFTGLTPKEFYSENLHMSKIFSGL